MKHTSSIYFISLLFLGFGKNLLYAQDSLLLDAGKKSSGFLLSASLNSELTIISGRAGEFEIWHFDSSKNQIFQASMPVEMHSINGCRMFSFIDHDTLRLFIHYTEPGRLKSFAINKNNGLGVFTGDFFVGAKFKTIGLRIFNQTLRLYLIPEEQSRMLVYFSKDGRLYDLEEYTIRIPAFYRRITQNPYNKYQYTGREYVAQMENIPLDPPSYLSFQAKFYTWGETIALTIDDEDALHYQEINEVEQSTRYFRFLIRIPGVRQNQAIYYSSIALENGEIFRLTRAGRQYYLSTMNPINEALIQTHALFNNNTLMDSVAQLYTETIERGRERRLKDREYKIKQLKRILNDGTAVLRIEQLNGSDTLLMDIGALRFIESVYTTQPRYNSLNYFDFGYDPSYHYSGQYYGRSSNYFVYDYIKCTYHNQNWNVLMGDVQGLRLKMMESINTMKENTQTIYYDVVQIGEVHFLMYQDKFGKIFYRKIN